MSGFYVCVDQSFWLCEMIVAQMPYNKKDVWERDFERELKNFEGIDPGDEESIAELTETLERFLEEHEVDYVTINHAPRRVIAMARRLDDMLTEAEKTIFGKGLEGRKAAAVFQEAMENWEKVYSRYNDLDSVILVEMYDYFDAHPFEEVPERAEGDKSTVDMALFFSLLPEAPESDEDREFLKGISVNWEYEQRHMVRWLMGQLSPGAGAYRRSRPNLSFKAVWNRLRNPFSLLWMAFVLGVDRDDIARAARNCEEYKGNIAGQCAAVRRIIPFSVAGSLAQERVLDIFCASHIPSS